MGLSWLFVFFLGATFLGEVPFFQGLGWLTIVIFKIPPPKIEPSSPPKKGSQTKTKLHNLPKSRNLMFFLFVGISVPRFVDSPPHHWGWMLQCDGCWEVKESHKESQRCVTGARWWLQIFFQMAWSYQLVGLFHPIGGILGCPAGTFVVHGS